MTTEPDVKKFKILYLITKSNFGNATRQRAAHSRNPRFLALLLVTGFLHGELPFPDPLPRSAVVIAQPISQS